MRERERESLPPECVLGGVGWGGGVRQVLLVCNTNLSVILTLRIINLQLGEGQVQKFLSFPFDVHHSLSPALFFFLFFSFLLCLLSLSKGTVWVWWGSTSLCQPIPLRLMALGSSERVDIMCSLIST